MLWKKPGQSEQDAYMRTLAPGMEQVSRMEQHGRIYDPIKEEERQFMGPIEGRRSSLPGVQKHFNKMTPDEERIMDMGMDMVGKGLPPMMGIMAGRKAKSYSSLVNKALDEVDELMAKQGIKSSIAPQGMIEKQFKQHGVYIGVEGATKFEIDDSVMRLKQDYFNKFTGQTSLLTPDTGWANLEDIIDHPTLFDEYPHLRSVKIRKQPMDDARDLGAFDPSTGAIHLNEELFAVGKEEKLKDVITHELQHVVQFDEDFALGGSPQLANTRKALLEEWFDMEKDALDQLLGIKMGLPGNASQTYNALIEKSELGVPKASELAQQLKGQLDNLMKTDPDVMRMREKIIKYRDEMKKYGGTDLENYRRFAGEGESNEQMRRRRLTAEDRRVIPPQVVEGGKGADEWIVYRRGDEYGSSVTANFRERLSKLQDRISETIKRIRGE